MEIGGRVIYFVARRPETGGVVEVGAAGGVEVVFDWAIDTGAWPGPLRDGRDARAGVAWLGPLGLLDRLEMELGIGRVHASPIERAASLVRDLEAKEGFWSRSLSVDALTTATRLLDDRDALAICGWHGEPASERLSALWNATSTATPGIPDRLRRVSEKLSGRAIDVASISVVEPVELLPLLWQQVFASLHRCGVQIRETPLGPVAALGDLRAARIAGFVPAGDGSLQLVRPHGPVEAAEEVAAALSACSELDGIVVVGSDGLLDAALARHGMPRLGGDIPAAACEVLVRLCIESAFQPMDAAALHALICADPGPVPRRVAWRLVLALRRHPGRGSSLWREGLTAGLASIEEDRRGAVEARLAALLEPVAPFATSLTLAQLRSRMTMLSAWAVTRIAGSPGMGGVVSLAGKLVTVVESLGIGSLDLRMLRRVCNELEQPYGAGPAAERGLAAVRGPGAILGPARVVVWCGASRSRAPAVRRVQLSIAERKYLAAVGVVAPDNGRQMASEARRWRRALEQASSAVVLICPRFDEQGEPAHPHPLWDELIGAMPDPSLALRLVAPRVILGGKGAIASARRSVAVRRPAPIAIDAATASRPIPMREVESSSSIEKLLGCSLAYTLHYPGRLRAGLVDGAGEPSPLLYGNLAHYVLARVFTQGSCEPDVAAARAAQVCDDELPGLAETLCLAHRQGERASVRRAIVESARAVAALIARTGSTIRGVELRLEGRVGATAVAGPADLVLSAPPILVDYKWGASTSREHLRAGSAIQLVLYADLAQIDGATPAAGYFVVGTQRMLAPRATPLSAVNVPGAHSMEDMRAGVLAALDQRLAELASGSLVAPGAISDPQRSQLAGGVLRHAPACGYCGLAGVCGRRGRA